MNLEKLLAEKKMSIYRLAKLSEIPYATLNDICNGKTRLEKCSAETVYRLSAALGVSMEALLSPCLKKRSDFENFKSTVCHRVKEMGDVDFIIDILKNEEIRECQQRQWYRESLYLLAMLDYLSRLNNIPLCEEYDDLRRCRLENPVYPAGILALSEVNHDPTVLETAYAKAIPEFRRFNIVESEVREVV